MARVPAGVWAVLAGGVVGGLLFVVLPRIGGRSTEPEVDEPASEVEPAPAPPSKRSGPARRQAGPDPRQALERAAQAMARDAERGPARPSKLATTEAEVMRAHEKVVQESARVMDRFAEGLNSPEFDDATRAAVGEAVSRMNDEARMAMEQLMGDPAFEEDPAARFGEVDRVFQEVVDDTMGTLRDLELSPEQIEALDLGDTFEDVPYLIEPDIRERRLPMAMEAMRAGEEGAR